MPVSVIPVIHQGDNARPGSLHAAASVRQSCTTRRHTHFCLASTGKVTKCLHRLILNGPIKGHHSESSVSIYSCPLHLPPLSEPSRYIHITHIWCSSVLPDISTLSILFHIYLALTPQLPNMFHTSITLKEKQLYVQLYMYITKRQITHKASRLHPTHHAAAEV